MNEGTNEPRSIEERQDDIVADFLSIDDPLSQYEYLLEFAAALPALDEAQKTDENLVEGCQSQVWLVLEDRGGRLGLQADSDTLIVRGVLQLLVQVVDGQLVDSDMGEMAAYVLLGDGKWHEVRGRKVMDIPAEGTVPER